MTKPLKSLLLALLLSATSAFSQNSTGPLRIEITDGVIEPLPFAIPDFVAENPESNEYARKIVEVITADLTGTGLFRAIPARAHIGRITSFSRPVEYLDWMAINAQALVTGSVDLSGTRQISVNFRLFDVFAGREMGKGLRMSGKSENWRRIAHNVADEIYSRITGEAPYFNSKVVFVSETGPKGERSRKLSIMDYDGANVANLTDDQSIVLAPRFSPDGGNVIFTSYQTGFPRIHVLSRKDGRQRPLVDQEGTMSFSPRYSPDGRSVVYSLTRGGNTDLYLMNVSTGASKRLSYAPSIETAPSFSPDGKRIAFTSDRSGRPQLYIARASGGDARRISFGRGNYNTPVWSPRGDLIAFTKQHKNRFHIGVMRTDGSEERLLTASFHDEGPTWSPNGRVIMFTRETRGAQGMASLYTVDITGRNLKRLETPTGASGPDWSPLQK
ncbi:MAG: Tol-Pal system beta propeller repeat protein TolB [Roseovarius sp.]|nr:Tol-Pal system beta propeller repeat protein TolB [Roseovarius sp.]